QIPLLINLSDEEKIIIDVFSKKPSLHVDELCQTTEFTISKISALLLQLEFSNVIKSRPGKMYELA
ncbi:MAG: DNA-protecting protein DprA, partial [Bacteroidota bacterium]